jgi:hypothetical protein
MTLYNCPSPRGSNNAQLFLTKAGHLVDRHGRDWGKSQIARLAMDELPSSARDLPAPELTPEQRAEVEEDERVQKLCHALEAAMEKLNLRPEYAGALLKVIEQHKKHEWKTSGAGAKDEEPDRTGLHEFLRGRGLSEDDLEELDEILARSEEEPAEDRLPVPATKGGYGGYRSGRSKDDGQSFERKFPEAGRIGTAVPGRSQFDGAHDRRSTRRTRKLAADAASAEAGRSLAEMFPGIERIAEAALSMWADVEQFLYSQGYTAEAVARILEIARQEGLVARISRVLAEREEVGSLH